MAIKLILADFDGTLVDSMPYWVRLPWDFMKENGIAPPEDFDALLRSRPMWEVAQLLMERYPRLQGQGDVYERWLARMEQHYRQDVAFKDGAVELLHALRAAGVRVCLLSATRSDLLHKAVAHFGVEALVDGVVSEKDVGASKRCPEPYYHCMERFGVTAEETLLLEDSCPNLCTGHALGLYTCAVYDEFMAKNWPTMLATADVCLQSPAQGEKLLDFLRERDK